MLGGQETYTSPHVGDRNYETIGQMLEGISEAERRLLAGLLRDATLGRLLDSVLHELRNPLNSICTSAQLLSERSEDLALRDKLLPVITRCASSMAASLDAVDVQGLQRPLERPLDLHEALACCLQVLSSKTRYLEYHPSGVTRPAWVDVTPEIVWTVLLATLDVCTQSGAKNLWVSSREDKDVIRLIIEHDGAPTCEAPSDKSTSTGLAMELSSVLLSQDEAGELECQPREPMGSRVTLSLRKAFPRSNEQDPLRR